MSRADEKVYATKSEYLDPLGCDSVVSYAVIRTRQRDIRGTVDLSDCNRKIQWYFRADPSSLAKIDKAIVLLTEFKIALARVMSLRQKRTKRRKV